MFVDTNLDGMHIGVGGINCTAPAGCEGVPTDGRKGSNVDPFQRTPVVVISGDCVHRSPPPRDVSR